MGAHSFQLHGRQCFALWKTEVNGDLKTKNTKLLSFDSEWNFSPIRVNMKRVTADILPHSGHKYNLLDAHLPSLGRGEVRGVLLSHNSDNLGITQSSIEYVRASRRRSWGVGGSIEANASLRIEAKPQRVEVKHRFPLFIREVVFFEITTHKHVLISKLINNGLEIPLGIQDGEEGIKVVTFDISK